MILITLSLIVATFVESYYTTKAAQYWVYQSWYFRLLLLVLGIEILFVALSRWPWQKRHLPFLSAHAGIILLLLGSWITQVRGIDGSLRVMEGESSNQVDLDQNILYVAEESGRVFSVQVPWIAPNGFFSPVDLRKRGLPFDLTIAEFLPHAEAKFSFRAKTSETEKKTPAIKLRLSGGPMQITQEYWLWEGDTAWKVVQAGPAVLSISSQEIPMPAKGPWIIFSVKNSEVSFVSVNSVGDVKKGKVKSVPGKSSPIDPGWKMVKLEILEVIPDAENHSEYTASQIIQGPQAPASAIRLMSGSGKDSDQWVWLGVGDRTAFEYGDKKVTLTYQNRRLTLPFSIELDRFTVGHDPGTRNPAEYSSKVRVIDQADKGDLVTISMNEPLKHRGVTFYQASYEEAEPRPMVSILSVNQDPGRIWKYLGSLLIVLGAAWLFLSKMKKKPEAVS